MLLKPVKYKILHESCNGSSLRAAQHQFLCLIVFVAVLCLCVNLRLFHGNAPLHVAHPYAIPETFITSECGDERRLGNTMFTYASLLGIAVQNNMTPVISEGIRLTHIFNITTTITDDLANIMGHYDTYEEYGKRGGAFDINLMELNSRLNVRLLGYLQSWKYFSRAENEVRRNFAFRDNVKTSAQNYISKLLLGLAESAKPVLVGIHVRMGDMMEDYYRQYGYVTAPPEYFQRAMNYFKRKYNRVQFVVCSDNIRWSIENLRGPGIAFSEGNTEAVDLAILSSCDHMIISVGSFGWWAAWIANGTTIYYKKWPRPLSQLEYQVEKRDYFPPHWIPME